MAGYVEMPGSVYFNTGQGRTFHEVPWNDGKGTVYGLAFADFAQRHLVQHQTKAGPVSGFCAI